MKKILKINLFLLLLFFAFNIKVKAIPSLTCRYYTTALPNYFEYVALVQDSYGKMGIFFSRDNISYSNLNEFKNGTVYIENFSKNFITSGNYPYFNDCPQYFFLDIYYDPELTLNLSDGNDKYYEENKSNYTYLIGKDDIRKEIFDDLEFPDSLEVYNELDEKSYSITGIEKWIDSTGRPETPSTDEEHIYKEKLDYMSAQELIESDLIIIAYVV